MHTTKIPRFTKPAFWPEAKTLAQAEFISAEHVKFLAATIKIATPFGVAIFMVRLTGVEPVRPFGHKHLKLASLPIPAQPQISGSFRTA